MLLHLDMNAQVLYNFLQFGDISSNNRGSCLLPDQFGNVLFAGTVANGISFSDDVYISKIDETGAIIWNNTYGTGNNEFVNNCIGFDNRYLIVCGNMTDSISGNTDGMLLKIDTTGNLIWLKNFGDALSNEDFIGITILSNDNIAVTGFTTADVGLGNDVLTVIFNQSGDVEHSFIFGTTNNDYGVSILETPGGDLIVSGDRAIDALTYNPFFARTSVEGVIQFDNIFNLPENSGCKAMHFNIAGNLIFTGETATPIEAVFDILITEADTNGNLLFSVNIPGAGAEAGYDIAVASDSTYVITGFGYNPETSEIDIVAVQVDLSGNLIARKYFGANGADLGYDIKMDANGSFWLAGFTTVDENVLFALIYDTFDTAVGMQDFQILPSINIYPNPFSNRFTIESNEGFHKIEIANLAGAVLYQAFFEATVSTSLSINFPPGLYIIKLFHQTTITTCSVVVN